MKKFGLIGRKLGMTSVFNDRGVMIPVTLIHIPENLKIENRDNNKVLLGIEKPKALNKPQVKMFEKLNLEPKKVLKEFSVSDNFLNASSLSVSDLENIEYVDVRGVTKGKGFAGPMKRHGFAGLRASHGVSKAHRSHGSTGQCQDPGRVFKGKKMAGHMGCDKAVQQNLRIFEIDKENNLLAVIGAVPGPKKAVVFVTTAIKKKQMQGIL